jgi:hypothetical protein
MTYNFDPDRWYENERAALEERWRSGAITESEFKKALQELDRRYDELWKRLDGSFQIPE